MSERSRFETRSGAVLGRIEAGLHVLRGVPFAAAPIGALRWAPPERERAWAGVRDAAEPGPAAPQRGSAVMRMLGLECAVQDEACLTLQVWSPEFGAGRRPVLVFLHGGAFTSAAGSLPLFDGSLLARRGDAVVVTLNYRLGALGFLSHSEGIETGVGANFGLLDQIAALEWVREHAAALGGDPDNVTVFGESAGAMSIGALLSAPAARGLFAKAILQSGAAHNVSSRAGGRQIEDLFRAGFPGAGIGALRAVSVEDVLLAQGRVVDAVWNREGLAFQPIVDGAVLPSAPLAAIAGGSARGVPLLVGTNMDEWRLFALPDAKLRTLDEAGLLRRLVRVPPGPTEDPEKLARHAVDTYRAARSGALATDPASLWIAMQTDRVFRIPALRLLEHQERHAPVFSYLFDWASPALGGLLGSCHALELPFVFGTLEDARAAQLVGTDDAARRLAGEMQDAWLAFARCGDPGWPAYDESERATQRLGRECGVERDPMGAEREFWEGRL